MNDSEKTVHFAPPKRVEWALTAALTILAVFLLVLTLDAFGNVGRPDTPAMNTITVTGEGSVTKAPDIARITFTVQNTASTVAEAQEMTTEQANDVLDYVRDEDVDDEDIKTVSYSVTPQYSYPSPCPPGALCAYRESSPRITGYQVSQTVEVKVRDLDQVGTLLAGLGSRNVQNLYGPDFALDDPKEAQAEAREMAIDEAQAEAKLLARQLGVRLVRIVNFSDSGNYPIYYARDAYGFGGDTAVAQSAPAPDIPQGEQEYSSYVTITYEIR